jgi:glucose-1-phosphate adenylyltransferase
MGIYAFKREVLVQALSESCEKEKGYDFGHHIIPSLIGSAHIRAYDFHDKAKDTPYYWRDVGTLDSYYEASMDLVRPEMPFDPYTNGAWPSYPAHYESSSHLGALDGRAISSGCAPSRLRTNRRVKRSILSPGIRIENGGLIESSVLMSGVWVGQHARIRQAIIEEGVHIPAGFQIGFDLEDDRKHYFVTDGGVVVVSHTPKHTRPIVVCFVPKRVRRKPIKSSRVA